MAQVETISESKNYTAVNIGSLDNIEEFSLIHPKNKAEIKGKVFLKDATAATGTEISFQMLPAGEELGYFHIHNQNEETYIILKGSGYFQVDNDSFPVSEGSVVRVAPAGKRGLCNSSEQPMLYMVIQSKENSLEQWSSDDGERVQWNRNW